MNLSIVWSMFAVGLVTSIHCVFMCGGLVLTYAVKGTEDGPWYRRLVPHLAYQGAKIVSYATVALLLSGLVALLGRAVDITPFRNWLQVVAGIYMVLLGIGMTGKVPVLRYLTPRPPKFLINALSKNRKKATADANDGTASLATPISFGLLTGLMPCAPLIAAQASAMATGSPLLGVLAMVGFGLGTMPLMLAFGFASSSLSRGFQAKMQVVAAAAVMIFGLVILNRGLMVVGSPVTFDTVRTAVIGGGQPAATDTTQYAKGADGVIEIPLTIENVAFAPQNLSIPADTPVRIIVDRREANACSAQLAIPKAGVLVDLKDNGITSVDVPAMPAGSYTLTCGMGMMSGGISVGGNAAGAVGGTPPLLVPAVLVALIGGGYAAVTFRSARRRQTAPAAKTTKGSGTANRKGGAAPAAKDPGSGKSVPDARGSRTPESRPAPAPAGFFASLGFDPVEIVIGGSIVVMASIIGLASGGLFR